MEKSAFFVFNPLQKLIENSKGRIIYIFDLTNTHLNLKNGWEEVYSLKGIRKIAPYENTAYESSPPLPPEFFTRENCPLGNNPQWNPLPTYNSYKWKKKHNYKSFCLEESCAIQHPFDTQIISQKMLGLDTFFTEWKNAKIERKRKSPSGIYLPVVQVK